MMPTMARRAALAVALSVSVSVTACGAEGDDATPPIDSSTTMSPGSTPTSLASTTTFLATTTTTTVPTVADGTRFLVHGPAGIGLWSVRSGLEVWIGDTPIAAAQPDGRGGVFYQAPFDAGTVEDPNTECEPIWHLSERGAEPGMVVEDRDGECVTLHAGATIDGHSHLIYTSPVPPLEDDEPGVDDVSFQDEVVLLDFTTGEDSAFTRYWTIDGGLHTIALSERRIALTLQGSSDQGVALFHDVAGNPEQPPFPPPAEPIGEGDCWAVALSPDGSRLAYAPIWTGCGDLPGHLRIIDLDTGDQLADVVLPDDGPFPGTAALAFDPTGSRVLVTLTDQSPWVVTVDRAAGAEAEIRVLHGAPDDARIVQKGHDEAECVMFMASDGERFCATGGGITFWPPTGAPPAAATYVATGPAGVHRVVDGEATLVSSRADAIGAHDDGAGGVVIHSGGEGGAARVEHWPTGATEPTELGTQAAVAFTTLVNGRPTAALTVHGDTGCDDHDEYNFVLVDLATGDSRVYRECIPLEAGEGPPRSMGGDLGVSVAFGGWPGEAAVWSRLVFRDLAGNELDLTPNPWRSPCDWCTLRPLLSPDGTRLAIAEYTPEPTDLGAVTWAEFDALSIEERWRRFDRSQDDGAELRLRVIDLRSGETLYRATRTDTSPWSDALLDFDGRHLVWRDQQTGAAVIIDATTGDETPVVWPGGSAPEPWKGSVRLALPSPS